MVQIFTPTVSLAASGNIVYVPSSGIIEDYISDSNDGDTLILAGGMYTIHDDIDVTKAVNITGQGIDRTTIYCYENNKNIFQITESNTSIKDLSIISAGASGRAIFIDTIDNKTGIFISNVDITMNAPGYQYGIHMKNSGATIDACRINVTSLDDYGIGIYMYADSNGTDNWVSRISGTRSEGAGIYTSCGIRVEDDSSAVTATANVYNSILIADPSTGCFVDGGANAIANLYLCVLEGTSSDIVQADGATVNIYGCSLIAGLSSGSITYGGDLVAAGYNPAKYWYDSVESGITASVVQAQGQGLLTKDKNEISICANANDAVTLPSAASGMMITVTNSGAQTLQIFPNTSDQIDSLAVDASTTLASGKSINFISYNDTNWVSEALN